MAMAGWGWIWVREDPGLLLEAGVFAWCCHWQLLPAEGFESLNGL